MKKIIFVALSLLAIIQYYSHQDTWDSGTRQLRKIAKEYRQEPDKREIKPNAGSDVEAYTEE